MDFLGFACAGSGKRIEISAESLAKAELLFSDDEDSFTTEVANRKRNLSDKDQAKTVFGEIGFSFGGKKMSISNEALEKAAKLLADSQDISSKPPLQEFKRKRPALGTGGGYNRTIPFRKNPNAISVVSLKRKQEEIKSNKKVVNPTPKYSLKNIQGGIPLKAVYNSKGLLISIYNSEGYRFNCECFESLMCSCSQINRSGWTECYNKLLEYGLRVSNHWVKQHYRLIVWKYAGYSRKLKDSIGLFTLGKVLLALKKRYNTEVVQVRRSILQKIQQKDESPAIRMVLCAGEIEHSPTGISVELTDGWNSMYSFITNSNPLSSVFTSKKIREGMKLNVIGCSCSEDGLLRLSYNSVRRARWDTRLGQAKPVPFPVNIKSLKPNGGLIICVIGYITKIYQELYYSFSRKEYKKHVFNEEINDYQSSIDIKIKDAIIDHSTAKAKSAIINIKSGSLEGLLDCLKPGYKYSFYSLIPAHFQHTNTIVLTYTKKSRFYDWNKKRANLIKQQKTVSPHDKIGSERIAIGVLISFTKSPNNDIVRLLIATESLQLIEIVIHDSNFFLLLPNLNIRDIICLKNIRISLSNSDTLRCKTTYNTEILTSPENAKQFQGSLESITQLVHVHHCLRHYCECPIN